MKYLLVLLLALAFAGCVTATLHVNRRGAELSILTATDALFQSVLTVLVFIRLVGRDVDQQLRRWWWTLSCLPRY